MLQALQPYNMHIPVLLNEIIEYLDPKPGEIFIDATLNGGGHAREIIKRISPGGKFIGIEWDKELAERFSDWAKNEKLDCEVTVVNDSYANIKSIAERLNLSADGILFDLGLSSYHYEGSGRGFSFQRNEPLDMRFNTDSDLTAQTVVNTYPERDLARIIREYGEEGFSNHIAKAIVEARKVNPIITSDQLARIIEGAVPHWYRNKRINPSTKTFQAIRVEVNQELENVRRGVGDAIDVLNKEGRMAVISFQGLEDKIVKEIFRSAIKSGQAQAIVKGTVKSTWDERKANPRSRSAKLKLIRKII